MRRWHIRHAVLPATVVASTGCLIALLSETPMTPLRALICVAVVVGYTVAGALIMGDA